MVLAIIQARMGSTRLPGKVLAPIGGKPMLWHVIHRIMAVRSIDQLVVATSDRAPDNAIEQFCIQNHMDCYRGSETDVLDRFYKTAAHYLAQVIVRITADCPLIDPGVTHRVISAHEEGSWDYTSNTILRSYPDGLDVEVFTFEALKKAWNEATLMSEREHVTPYIWKNRHLFKVHQITQMEDQSNMRWTVDEPEDLEFVRRIYHALNGMKAPFQMEDVLHLIHRHPELAHINRGFICNEGYLKSLEEDQIVWKPPGTNFSDSECH
jgi:spore coat polysaccharide biosynthesis protein SpsF (cytidylyltransferase family)